MTGLFIPDQPTEVVEFPIERVEEDEQLRMARGVILGLAAAVCFWLVVAVVVVAA